MSDVTPLIDVEKLLAPIGGDSGQPAGRDIRHDPVFTEINLARKAAEANGSPAAQAAAWARVADLAAAALASHSKHLQVGVWLTEALSRIEGFRGAACGFQVLGGMMDRFWASLYPAIDSGDPEPLAFRTGPLQWVAERLPDILKSVPLSDQAPYGLLHYEATLKTGDERQALLDDGWPSGDQFRQALRRSRPAFLKQSLQEVEACQRDLASLEGLTDRLFVEERTSSVTGTRYDPILSFLPVRDALETASVLLSGALAGESATAAGGQSALTVPGGRDEGGLDGIAEARSMVSSNQLEGLRVLQARVSAAESGRERFLRRLQFAEVCLESGMHSLALPMFVEITRLIEERTLATWEREDVILRAWRGLKDCCERDGSVASDLSAWHQQAVTALGQIESKPAPTA